MWTNREVARIAAMATAATVVLVGLMTALVWGAIGIAMYLSPLLLIVYIPIMSFAVIYALIFVVNRLDP